MLLLSRQSFNPLLCRRGDEMIRADDFLALIEGVRNQIDGFGPRVLISLSDSFFFAAAFLGTIASQRRVVILPNTRPGTLAEFADEYDNLIDDETMSQIQPLAMADATILYSGQEGVTFFTSGSSGRSKKIEKRLGQLIAEALELEKNLGPKDAADGLVLSTAVHQHIYGFLFKIFWPLLARRTWLSDNIEFPEQIECWSRKVNSFILISTPAFLKRYVPSGSEPIRNCRGVFSSGGVLELSTALEIQNWFRIAPMDIYGSTETGGIARRNLIKDGDLWLPFSVVDIQRSPDGHLRVRSPYTDSHEVWMSDRIEFVGEGFRMLGRSDDIVKIEDKRVSLSEMSRKLVDSRLIEEAVCVCLEGTGRQQIGCLAVLTESGKIALEKDGSQAVVGELRSHLNQHFEGIVLPRRFRFVDQLPYNEHSKLIKSELGALFQ